MGNFKENIFCIFAICAMVLASAEETPLESPVNLPMLNDIKDTNTVFLSGINLIVGAPSSQKTKEGNIENLSTNVVQNDDDLIFSGDQGLPEETDTKPTIILNPDENDDLNNENINNIEIITSPIITDSNNGLNPEGMESEAEPSPSTTEAPEIVDTTQAVSRPECLTNETLPNPQDCHQYYLCAFTAENNLEALPMVCPASMGYNSRYKRCSRDISDCDDGMICNIAGTFPILNDNTSYWWCTPALIGGFHKFLVRCPTDQFFMPEIDDCFYDIQNLPTTFAFDEPKDIDAIKLELKQFKLEEKERLKAEKMKAKMAKKYQKLLEKQAKKEAKEKAELLEASD